METSNQVDDKKTAWQLGCEEQGVETIEYLGLAAVLAILVGAVALYLSGAGQALIAAVRDLISAIIAGFARGW